MDYETNCQQAEERIARCCELNGRPRKDVTLCVVTKWRPVEAILALYRLGHRVFGENRVAEICDKSRHLPLDCQIHFIGQLQRNKVRALLTGVPQLTLVESVDSEPLAAKLHSGGPQLSIGVVNVVVVSSGLSAQPQDGPGCSDSGKHEWRNDEGWGAKCGSRPGLSSLYRR